MSHLTVGEHRPYPATGLTSARWRAVPVVTLRLADVVTTQRHVAIDALLDDEHRSYVGDPVPHVVHWRGRHYLEDGHTRVTRLAARGWRTGQFRVLHIHDETT